MDSILWRIRIFFWYLLIIFIFLRPFISEYAFFTLGFWYVFLFIIFSLIYLFIFRGVNPFFTPLNLAVSLFLLIILISLIIRGFTIFSIYEFYLFCPNFLIFYIMSKTDSLKRKQVLEVVTISAILVSIYTIYQYFIGLDNVLNYIVCKAIKFDSYTYIKEVLIGKRAFATFVSPNLFASYLVMVFFLTLGSLFLNRKKIIPLFGLILIFFSLLCTKSVGGILTFMLVFIFWSYFYIHQTKVKKLFFQKVFMVTVFLLFSLILVFLFINRQKISNFFDLSYRHNSIVQRLYYWQTALRMIKDYPFLGIGWCKFGIFYYFYKPNSANISNYAHNVFLQIFAELGIFGLLSFLIIISLFLKRAIKLIKDSCAPVFNFSCLCAGLAFLIHNLFDLSFYFGQIAFFWWLTLGMMNSSVRKEVGEK